MSWMPKSYKARRRLIVVGVAAIVLGAASVLALSALKEGVVYFYTPTQMHRALAQGKTHLGRVMRLGGLVATSSVVHEAQGVVRFDVKDPGGVMHVTYHGDLPDLFREGQGVVCEGRLSAPDRFDADTVLAKHDEKYMPRDVVKALKAEGQWRGGATGTGVTGGGA